MTIEQTESQKIRYEMRNEIENIIKEKHIDRTAFHEAGKGQFQKVQKKIYYSFCDYHKYPTMQYSYMWTRFRRELKQTELIYTDWSDWDCYIEKIDSLIPAKNPDEMYYLLVDGGWVYEGTLSGIKQVLHEYPMSMDDFYITPKDFSWLVVHCEDGGCMNKMWNAAANR